ncbi:MAG TPA: cytochrome c oxidase subunit II [Bacteroidales bacterium]|jgi:cytochrome c oxidase subunit 2|nr:cytochrome c oxidase subunit II [Bacteroidales bacterium]
MFTGVSNFTNSVDRTTMFIFLVSAFFLVGITAAMIFFVIRYNKKRNPKSEHIEGNAILELVWTLIPLALVMIMFFYGWRDWKMFKTPPKDAFTVSSTARMWSWSFEYPNGKITDTLYVPANKPVIVNVNSADVIHSMFIPAFRIKQDMVPGNDNYLWFIANKEGTYEIFCAEYCGLQHSYMTSAVNVLAPDTFDKWYNDTSLLAATAGTGGAAPMAGLGLMRRNGCVACHSLDGSTIVGPSFKGIFGEETIVIVGGDEQQVTVNEDYIRESLLTPNAKVVKGFRAGLMQSYKGMVTEEDILQITEYIKSLK